MDVKRNQLKRQRNEARRDMENVRDDLLQAQAELKSFEDQREDEREEIQREKMIANRHWES
jgi:predicted  nucleic acid-binding Zn-ribbon protein